MEYDLSQIVMKVATSLMVLGLLVAVGGAPAPMLELKAEVATLKGGAVATPRQLAFAAEPKSLADPPGRMTYTGLFSQNTAQFSSTLGTNPNAFNVGSTAQRGTMDFTGTAPTATLGSASSDFAAVGSG